MSNLLVVDSKAGRQIKIIDPILLNLTPNKKIINFAVETAAYLFAQGLINARVLD